MRYPDWQNRFWKEMEVASRLPLVWGESDCILFAAKMADAISDGEFTKRAKEAFAWRNEREALQLMRGGLQPLIESVLGQLQPWTSLSQGDIVLVIDDKGRECAAIHDGCQIIGKAAHGIQTIPFRCVKGGWRVD
jgi:hypothetical protein